MKCLLNNQKLIFAFTLNFVSCFNVNYYQNNGILSFAVLDLAYKIIKQHKREYIVLKKRHPIIHLLNYIDALNFNSKKFGIIFFLKNKYKTKLAYSLYYYRSKDFKNFDYGLLKDCLKVIEHENSCTIRFDDYTRIQLQNVNLVAMVIHILEKEKSDAINNEIDVSGIVFYCVLLT